jgi:hypothetical protein
MDEEKRYKKLRGRLCPSCSIYATCAQFPEQLEACADATRLIKLAEADPQYRGRDLIRERLDAERHARQDEKANDGNQ